MAFGWPNCLSALDVTARANNVYCCCNVGPNSNDWWTGGAAINCIQYVYVLVSALMCVTFVGGGMDGANEPIT